MNRRTRWPIVIVLLVALIATGFTRQFVAGKRTSGRGGFNPDASRGAQFSRMNSYALALLLGGLRGPLVMVLWINSEGQKTEKNLEGFDTQIEWIRLLQPEFDTVHIFQMWNKAYNVSVQMASLSNKYLTIIDAIEYGKNVDRERPDNINILYAIGSIYGDKLGDSAEKAYYSRRVRDESLPHKSKQRLSSRDPGYRRLELDPVLDEKGNVLPQLLEPVPGVRIVDPALPTDIYDGSELGFLKKFQPFPYGIGPHGFAYNYRKRAQLLLRLANQTHAQLSELVIDTRPAGDLKRWAESEWERGRRLEIQTFGKAMPTELSAMQAPTADVPLDAKIPAAQQALIEQTISGYDLAARAADESVREYTDHLTRDPLSNPETYVSERFEMMALAPLMRADRDYLTVMLRGASMDPAERAKLLASAKANYRRASARFGLMVMRYYVPDPIVPKTFPTGVTRQNMMTGFAANMDAVTPEMVTPTLNAAVREMQAQAADWDETAVGYLNNVQRAQARARHIP